MRNWIMAGILSAALSGCATLPDNINLMLDVAREKGYEYMAKEENKAAFVEMAKERGAEYGGFLAEKAASAAWERTKNALKPKEGVVGIRP